MASYWILILRLLRYWDNVGGKTLDATLVNMRAEGLVLVRVLVFDDPLGPAADMLQKRDPVLWKYEHYAIPARLKGTHHPS